jgi:2-aminoadipate transaminase
MYPYSRPFVSPASSPIRDLYKYLRDPETIGLSGGYPDATLFDIDGLREASVRAWQDTRLCLQYGDTDGVVKLKSEIIRLMERRGVRTAPENIVVTTGSQQAFDLLLTVMVNEGDVVCVEDPTYTNNIQALRVHGARMLPVRSDADGLDVAQLEDILRTARTDAERPKLLYTIPTFSNPTGATMSLARRLHLLELAVKYRFLIVEDDPYSEIRFNGEPVPSLRALAAEVDGAEDWVVHMASLSKIVAPGLRVAWSIAPTEITRRCAIAKQSADVGSSAWMQCIAAEYLAGGRLEAHLERISKVYGEKCAALCSGLRELLGEAVNFHQPDGGMFVWAKLSGDVLAADLLKQAIEQKVIFVPGAGFHVGSPDPTTLRLSFAAPSVSQITEGVRRLCSAWKALRAPA